VITRKQQQQQQQCAEFHNRKSAHMECESKSDTLIGATGTILKITQTIPEQHTRKYEIKELQNAAIWGTAHVL